MLVCWAMLAIPGTRRSDRSRAIRHSLESFDGLLRAFPPVDARESLTSSSVASAVTLSLFSLRSGIRVSRSIA